MAAKRDCGKKRVRLSTYGASRVGRKSTAVQTGAFDLTWVFHRFFDLPWCRVSSQFPEGEQQWIFNEAGYCLHAMGRLAEASRAYASWAGDMRQPV